MPEQTETTKAAGMENFKEQITEAVESGKTLVQMRGRVVTAVKGIEPRDMEDVERRCLEEVKRCAHDIAFRWEVQNKKAEDDRDKKQLIQGPSIRTAEILYRNWGNCEVFPFLHDETPRYLEFGGTFIDLQTGVSSTRLYRKHRPGVKSAVFDRDGAAISDKAMKQQDIIFQIGQSLAIRNAVLAGTPSWLHQRMMTEARLIIVKQVTAGKLDDEIRAIQKQYWREFGVDSGALKKIAGCETKNWDADIVADLIQMRQGLREGLVTLNEVLGTRNSNSQTMPQNDAPHSTGGAHGANGSKVTPSIPTKKKPAYADWNIGDDDKRLMVRIVKAAEDVANWDKNKFKTEIGTLTNGIINELKDLEANPVFIPQVMQYLEDIVKEQEEAANAMQQKEEKKETKENSGNEQGKIL